MLTELQIETIIAETCGTYRTGGSYTFEDVWNCIEKVLAAHNAVAHPSERCKCCGYLVTEEQRATLNRLAMILEAGQAENGIDHARAQTYADALRALLDAHNAGAQEPVAWAVYNGWCKIAFYMSEEGARDHAAAAQRSHDLSGSLAAFRAVPLYTHPQPITDAARDVAINELRNIVRAKRFDRKIFECDGEFADWAQNRARYALSEIERLDRATGE